jgi:hypothetical protein
MRWLIPQERMDKFLALAREADTRPHLFLDVALALPSLDCAASSIALFGWGVIRMVRG